MTQRDEVLDLIRQRRGRTDLLTMPRVFIDITGDRSSAQFLAQLLYWTDRSADPERWVYKSHNDWKRELGMGRSIVDRCRRRLGELGLLHETHRKANGMRTMHFRVDLDALRAAVLSLSAVAENVTPECATHAERPAGNRHRGLRSFRTPPTETTPETISETSTETSCRGVRAGKAEDGRIRRSSGKETADRGAYQPNRAAVEEPVVGGLEVVCERRYQAEVVDAGRKVTDDTLFDILERVSGFGRGREHTRLCELLADYPGVDHAREFKKFAEYWRNRTPARPWLSLRAWLERAQRHETMPPVAPVLPFVWRRAPSGRCYIVKNPQAAPVTPTG